MAKGGSVEGLDEVMKRLGQKALEVKGLTMDGLLSAGLLVERASKELTPVDTGNLKGSAYTRKSGDLEVEIGYAAVDYALPVHENMEAKHPVGQAKFLETALRNNESAILQILQDKAKLR